MSTESLNSLALGAHEIVIDGVVQRYHVAGSGPVCLVHPGGPGAHWEYLQMHNLERHMTAVYIAPIGAGESGSLPDGIYSMERYARFIDGLVAHLGLTQVFLLGHSAGGCAALQYAVDHSDRLAGLILYGSTPVFGPDMFAEVGVQLEAFAQRHAGRPEVADVLAAFQSQREPFGKAEVMEHRRRSLPAYFADYWGAGDRLSNWAATVDFEYLPIIEHWDARDELGKVSVPTLILVGRHDAMTPVRWAEEMHEKIADSQVTVFKNSGHFIHVEEPQAFVQAIAEFLSGTASETA
ncbi:alpha/beta hydrolase [Streptomyces sp. NPDC004528]|uniref:alpha/beta fold hydrolase n=1 Tax=Streptomyces sp. NPDC004528 TaxID=3154550 RepID=UPI0033A874A1